MTHSPRDIYAQKGLNQIARLLSLQDRNPFSPTYGCFKRTYWLDKTVDFPDALPQFGVLGMTLAYAYDMPFEQAVLGGHQSAASKKNIYFEQPKMLEWILAGMDYWTQIQHKDGSYDEFYPNEHGWTGPTGFLLYAMMKSYLLLEERGEFPEEMKDRFFTTARKSADFIIKYDEHGVLANHHAMGVLPVYYAHHVLGDQDLYDGYEQKLSEFLEFHSSEGWSLEYDGADIGYLSATVSFLGKVYKINPDERLLKVMKESTEFLSNFVYPNGFYAGSMGSRQTLHFYSHGCELLAEQMPLAQRVADALLESLGNGKIVPAEIQADRYFLYRIPEHLESWVDYSERKEVSEKLPYERNDFRTVYPEGRYYVEKHNNIYCIGNAAKGGVLKVFNAETGDLLCNDCGIIGKTTKDVILTSQWIDDEYTFLPKEHGFSVSGPLQTVPANKLFTPFKLIVFRVFLMLFGWHTGMAYKIKGLIRKILMLKSSTAKAFFYRDVSFTDSELRIADTIKIGKGVQFTSVQLGDEFFVRYVPQSRYFQSQEFDAKGHMLTGEQLKVLNSEGKLRLERIINLQNGDTKEVNILPVVEGTMGIEYSEGRKSRRALTYRLRRRADEVIRCMHQYFDGTPKDLLDLGPAEGKSLSYVQDVFPDTKMTGLEFSPELIDACTDDRLIMVEGDAMKPPFEKNSFDIVSATALIEHVESPIDMLKTMHDLLRPGGVIVITTPDPFFEKIAGAIGHLDDEAHQETMTCKRLKYYLEEAGFEAVEVEKFMCWPWGLPGELGIEKFMKSVGLRWALFNQLAVGKK